MANVGASGIERGWDCGRFKEKIEDLAKEKKSKEGTEIGLTPSHPYREKTEKRVGGTTCILKKEATRKLRKRQKKAR